jgi:hypothetical protein
VLFEVLSLGTFFFSTRVADSYMPEHGGSGDAASIYLWNGRAGLAFWSIVVLWVAALGIALHRQIRGGGSVAGFLTDFPRGAVALAAALPVGGLLIGYLVLLLL